MVYTFVFSPCGSTKKVADVLAEEFSSVKQEVDLTDPKKNFASVSLQAQDLAIVAVPSYGGRVPAVAIDRIQKIQGNKAKAIAVVVYGNRAYEDTLMELKDTLEEGGFEISGGSQCNCPSIRSFIQ